MKAHFLLLFFCFSLLFFPNNAQAYDMPSPPTTALFYPNEIHLTVEERIKPKNIPGKGAGLKIVLFPGALPATFSVTVDGEPANSFYWLPQSTDPEATLLDDPAPEQNNGSSPNRQALLKAVEAIQKEIDQEEAAAKTRRTRLSLWENINIDGEKFTPDDFVKLDNAFSERLTNLYAAASDAERTVNKLTVQLQKAQRALQEYDATQNCSVAVIPVNESHSTEVLVRYSYILPGSGALAYRLTAYPARDILRIEQDVTLFQNTGNIWKDADIYISTTRRDTSIRPSSLTPWKISLAAKDVPPQRPLHRMAQSSVVNMEQMAEVNAFQSVNPAPPVSSEMGTFRLWKLGKKTIANGVAVTMSLAKNEYKASYYYTIQPSINPKGFLTASLALDESLELPNGKARLFVDDVAIGEQSLSINGNRATLYFGADPQVTAAMRELKHSTGEKGIISKEQNSLLHWEILARNTRSRAVDIWIEDPLPDEQDTAISVAVESKPVPEKATTATQLGATKVYRWKFTLQPHETQTINHKVTISAPAESLLRSTRNR